MAKKEILTTLKLQIPAGKATPAPPVGPALGQHGLNISDFVSRFNDGTKGMIGNIVPVEITVYKDRSFEMAFKTPPASDLLKKAAGIEKGSGKNKVSRAGSVTKAQIAEIAEKKMVDLNAHSIETASKIIAGSARSMGIEVK
jgi:large subunit ribosomal protein L11